MVADVGLFAPDGVPYLVESAALHILEDKRVSQVVAPFQFKAHPGTQYHRFLVAG